MSLTPRLDKIDKNNLINGNFEFWQRGTSATSGSIVYSTADRWWHYGDFTSWSVSQVSDTSNGSRYAMRLSVTTLGAGTELSLCQPLETSYVRLLQGKAVTVSCLLKPNASYTGSINLIVKWGTGTDERNPTGGASLIKNITMSSLSTSQYTKVTSTVTIPSNATSLAVAFSMPAASVQAGSTIDIKNVMLLDGTHTDPEFCLAGRNYAEELSLCHRYYEKSYDVETPPGVVFVGNGTVGGVGNSAIASPAFAITVRYKQEKRATPLITFYNHATGTTGSWRDNGGSDVAVGFYTQGNSGFIVQPTAASVNGRVFIGHWVADAEI